VLFKSAEHFAQMWTKTLDAADAIVHPQVYLPSSLLSGDKVLLVWFAEEGDQVEETDDLADAASWRPAAAQIRLESHRAEATVQLDRSAKARFFRVRKP
jgi:hypothetical protein